MSAVLCVFLVDRSVKEVHFVLGIKSGEVYWFLDPVGVAPRVLGRPQEGSVSRTAKLFLCSRQLQCARGVKLLSGVLTPALLAVF